VPEAVLVEMWRSPCIVLEAPMSVRIALLRQEYSHFVADPAALGTQLDCLVGIHGREVIESWKRQALAGDWDGFIGNVLVQHYDPAYHRATRTHYTELSRALRLSAEIGDCDEFARLARKCIDVEA
jgi:tRNA 2-selenouridine synthase